MLGRLTRARLCPETLERLKSTSCKWSRERTIFASSRAKYNRHRKSQVLLTWRRFFPNAIAISESRLVWVTTRRERFSRIKNLRIALKKSRPCKCGLSGPERERLLHRVAQKYNRHRKSQVLLTRRRFFPNAIAASESRLVWVTGLRQRFSRMKNLRIALQKSRPCKCGFGNSYDL